MAEEDCGVLGTAAVLAAKPAHTTKANTRARIWKSPPEARPSHAHDALRRDRRLWPNFHVSVRALICGEEFAGGAIWALQ
jgi:hypothetical protein